MENNYKIIRDPIHGDIKITGAFLELVETPELQRLYNIKQLGFAHLVFPGAHHTRLEHSLGTFSVALKIAENLQLDKDDRNLVTYAALLHDIGHGPFSHTLESIILDYFGVDHIDLTEKLILGDYDIFQSNEKQFIDSLTVTEILEKYNINKKNVIDIIRGRYSKKTYLHQILNSTIDVDQLDYLVRDAYYTGVAYGLIDIERFQQTLTIHENKLSILRKGVNVVENILMARGLMYSSVYFHKTVRIAELMLSKALEELSDIEPLDFFKMTDSEITSVLKNLGKFQDEMITRLKYRKLFKQAYTVSFSELDNEKIKILKNYEDRNYKKEKESEFEKKFNITKGHLIIDIPRPELLRAEPRINRTDIFVIDKNESNKLDNYTPIAKAIRSRITPDWALMIITDERYRDIVSRNAEKIIYN